MNQPQKQLNVLLLGDICVDEYCFGTVSRISPEAPIPVLDFKEKATTLGMAGNVYNNLINLGCEVELMAGDAGKKTRFIDTRTNQQLLRLDTPPSSYSKFTGIETDDYDLIVISDYDKGFLSYDDIINIRKQFQCPIFLDTKKVDLQLFEGCIVKINNTEYSRVTSECSNLIVTYGGDKVTFDGNEYKVPKVEAFDVCGAGDTFLASLAVRYVQNNNMEDAINFAMRVSSITVKHLGVYAPTLEEIYNEA